MPACPTASRGDSGGPLFQYDANDNPVLLGVVSRGVRCADAQYPGLYVRTAAHTDFLPIGEMVTASATSAIMVANATPVSPAVTVGDGDGSAGGAGGAAARSGSVSRVVIITLASGICVLVFVILPCVYYIMMASGSIDGDDDDEDPHHQEHGRDRCDDTTDEEDGFCGVQCASSV